MLLYIILHYFVQMLLAKTMCTMHSAHMRHTRPIGRKRMCACICTVQLLGIVTCVNNQCSLETAGNDNYRDEDVKMILMLYIVRQSVFPFVLFLSFHAFTCLYTYV